MSVTVSNEYVIIRWKISLSTMFAIWAGILAALCLINCCYLMYYCLSLSNSNIQNNNTQNKIQKKNKNDLLLNDDSLSNIMPEIKVVSHIQRNNKKKRKYYRKNKKNKKNKQQNLLDYSEDKNDK